MIGAQEKSMTSGDFVFISLGLLPTSNYTRPWVRYDADDETASRAYFPLLQVCWKC